ncbi:hypothetical protein CDAR_606131 [Caerostris darwini]|uniref:Uncharacterized protein n=1 Tax=Caerostris darwini TaxID=1538125 RepID=A0AAV4NQU1_9ARAC|nr:hypothetical protein CDAR_606131 [Caerostris darwini]
MPSAILDVRAEELLFRSYSGKKGTFQRLLFFLFPQAHQRHMVCLFLQGPPWEASVPSPGLFEMSKNELSSLLCKSSPLLQDFFYT